MRAALRDAAVSPSPGFAIDPNWLQVSMTILS
jgi:hypothetical protein